MPKKTRALRMDTAKDYARLWQNKGYNTVIRKTKSGGNQPYMYTVYGYKKK